MKNLVKTMDEYASDLFNIATPDEIQKFLTYMAEGERIHALKIIQKYNLIEQPKINE